MLRLDACIHQTHPVDAGAMYGASDASLTTRLLACLPLLLASSCLCGLQAPGLPIEDCGVSMASWLLRCAAMQYWPAADRTHAMHSREGEQGRLTHSSPAAAWNASLPVCLLTPSQMGCYSMLLHANPTAAPLPGASGAPVWTRCSLRLQLSCSTMSQRLYCCPRIPRARRP